MENTSKKQPIAYQPNRAIRSLIGQDTSLKAIFTQDKINECQTIINNAKHSFYADAQPYLRDLKWMVKNADYKHDYDTLRKEIAYPLHQLKIQADTLNVFLVSHICKYLLGYCDKTSIDDKDEPLAKQFLELLFLVFKKEVADRDEPLVKEVLSIINKIQCR